MLVAFTEVGTEPAVQLSLLLMSRTSFDASLLGQTILNLAHLEQISVPSLHCRILQNQVGACCFPAWDVVNLSWGGSSC